MAEESDLERTEPASSRRLERAREEGNVPHSRELMAFFVLAAGVGCLWAMGDWFGIRSERLLRQGLSFGREAAFNSDLMLLAFTEQAGNALVMLAPLFLMTLAATVLAQIAIGGWNLSGKVLQFDFSRVNPLSGIKRMFSMQSVGELVKAVLKALLIALVIVWVVGRQRDQLLALSAMAADESVRAFVHILLWSAIVLVLGVALIAAIDVPFQLWQYYSRLRMTKEELRQEGKETEGDPQLKGRIRRQQREMARRRMMSEVPKANVVVTNPTHYAVALQYDSDKMAAPVIVAKGMDHVAARIREIAGEHKIPVLEVPALARALYRHAEIGDQIPGALYTAVAEVMAYVYQLDQFISGAVHGMLPPQLPERLAVPADMDPGAVHEVVA